MLASDAFFPFPDGPQPRSTPGSTAIVQPGGSKRDDEVVAAVREAGAAMVFTGRRHFRHWREPVTRSRRVAREYPTVLDLIGDTPSSACEAGLRDRRRQSSRSSST